MTQVPVLAAIQAVLHVEKYPQSMKVIDPDIHLSRGTMDTYFKAHIKVLEDHFGGGKMFPEGVIAEEISNHQTILIERLATGREQYLQDETHRREEEARAATKRAKRYRSNAPAVNPEAVTGMPLKECVRLLINNPVGRTAKVIPHLAHVAACAAAGAACCERGVSRMGRVKTALSTNMQQDLLDGLMHLGENSPFPYNDTRWDEYYIAALHLFNGMRERRVFLDLPTSKLLARPDPLGWSRPKEVLLPRLSMGPPEGDTLRTRQDFGFGRTFTDQPWWIDHMRRIRETEVTNQRKWLVVAAAVDTACIVFATGERVPYITDPTHMTVSEGGRIFTGGQTSVTWLNPQATLRAPC